MKMNHYHGGATPKGRKNFWRVWWMPCGGHDPITDWFTTKPAALAYAKVQKADMARRIANCPAEEKAKWPSWYKPDGVWYVGQGLNHDLYEQV